MSNVTYVRWQKDEPREGRVFPPLDPDHSSYGVDCLLCQRILGIGIPVQLLAIGPEDADSRDRHAQGRWYNALSIIVHASCLQGVDVPEPSVVAG